MSTIPNARPDRISLDYARLRSEGIQHLENIATEVWTDYNAHDPGITTLEVLCYALTDLAYRTNMLPIEDLAATGNDSKPFFLPEEILTCAPVTARDYRKLLIDVRGVKNAWIKVDTDSKVGIKGLIFKHFQTSDPTRGAILDVQKLQAAIEDWRVKNPTRLTEAQTEVILKILVEANTSVITNNTPFPNEIRPFFDEFLCAYQGIFEIQPGMIITLDGISDIVLDLDDDITPIEAKEKDEVLHAVWKVLHANRGLAQDYAKPITVLDREEIVICIDLEVATGLDERVVLAQVLYNLQSYLTPTVPFHSFGALLKKGIPAEDIFNGPLLNHGFIDDKELDELGAAPMTAIQRSDLFRVAKATDGVIDVRNIKIGWREMDTTYWANWEEGVFKAPAKATSTSEEWMPFSPNFKFWLDLSHSEFCIRQGTNTFGIRYSVIEEELQAIRMLNDSKLCNPTEGRKEPPTGQLRGDLDQYQSIQYDYPGVYRLGEHTLKPDAPGYHLGPIRQMQGYLMFYDQILAGYLKHLGQVGRLLSVNQDEDASTSFVPALLEVPGMRQLLAGKSEVELHATDWDLLLAEWEALRPKPIFVPTPAPKDETNVARMTREQADQKKWDAEKAAAKADFDQKFNQLRDAIGRKQVKAILDILNETKNTVGSDFIPSMEASCWAIFSANKSNNYLQALPMLAESDQDRKEQRNRILNHLLARFGEVFTDFSISLIRADINPEDNPGWHDFDTYLKSKADFLRDIPGIGYGRGLGMNYRKFSDADGKPDVWNAFNIPGLKRRVSALLGLDLIRESKTLLSQPAYKFDIRSKTGSKPQFFIEMRRTDPKQNEPLMQSAIFPSKNAASKLRDQLVQEIDQVAGFGIRPNDEDGSLYEVTFTLPGATQPVLRAAPMSLLNAEAQKESLQRLAKPSPYGDFEGFHVVEHILLRPDDPRDQYLAIPLGGTSMHPVVDPYSHWITVVAPSDTRRFKNQGFIRQFEANINAAKPAQVAVRFCYVTRDVLHEFEAIFRNWLEAKARCTPDECYVTDAANTLIQWINAHPAKPLCGDEPEIDCGCA